MIPLNGVEWKGVDLSGLELEFVQTRTETYTPEGGRKPDQVGFGSIKDDVERRDFTVNALLYDLTNNKIVDLVGGLEDIKKGIIRTPLNPDVIFNEDPLRMLRAVRFAGRYGWKIDPAIEESIKKNVSLLDTISRERVRDELVKILQGSLPKGGLKFIIEMGLWDYVFPNMAGLSKDIIFQAVDNSAGSEVLFLALLGFLSKGDVREACKSLKLANKEIKKVSTLMNAFEILNGNHDKSKEYKVRKAAAISAKVEALDELVEILPFFDSSKVDGFGEQPVVHFNGSDLMQMFNLKPGPVLADLTTLQREAWFEDPNVEPEEVAKKMSSALGLEVID
jgi:tRNA nucleotidyltransferase/poly(A) polymerase